MKRYSCSMDAVARYIPWLLTILSAVILFIGIYVWLSTGEGFAAASTGITGLLLPGLVIAMYLLHTRAVLMDDLYLTIDRVTRPVRISLSDIRWVERVPDMKYTVRTFGNGGVFGYTGQYYKKGIGSMTWYCTQRNNYVLLQLTGDKKIVVTPDDPDALIHDLMAANRFITVHA